MHIATVCYYSYEGVIIFGNSHDEIAKTDDLNNDLLQQVNKYRFLISRIV